jgi:2-dehydro-3-deoxy-D-arabinonate dehydratase
MKLAQFFLPGKGKRVALVRADAVADVTSAEEGVGSTLDLLQAGKTGAGLAARVDWLSRRLHRKAVGYQDLQRPPSRRTPHLLIPIDAPEIWRLEPTGGASAPPPPGQRPHLFFKGTASRAVGPHARAILRPDAQHTVAMPALAAVLGMGTEILAFTIGLDLTAVDVAGLGPGYMTQAAVYRGSCVLGPCLVTADELTDGGALQMRCRVLREHEEIVVEALRLVGVAEQIRQAIPWMRADEAIALGTVVLAPLDLPTLRQTGLAEGDTVEVEMQGIGRLATAVTRSLARLPDDAVAPSGRPPR